MKTTGFLFRSLGRPCRFRDRLEAVITIYLSLSLLLTAALIFTLAESARVNVMNSRLRSIIYMAEDSLFSAFAEPVFEDYGVMMLFSSEDELLSAFGEYALENLTLKNTLTASSADLYRASLDSVSLLEAEHPTDKEGQVFADQVFEYMDYYLAEDAASRILSSVSIFDQGDKVSAFMDKIEEYKDTFTKVEDTVSSVKKAIDKVRSIAGDPRSLLEQLGSELDSFDAGDESAALEFQKTLSELKNTRNQLSSALENVLSASDEYYSSVADAQIAISSLENDLDADKETYSDEVYAVVSEQVEDLRQKSADTDFDYYLVGANNSTTSSYISKLEDLGSLFSDTAGGLTKDNSSDYRVKIASFTDLFSDFNLDELGVNFDSSEIEKEDSSFLSSVSDFFEGGILGFVAGDISEKSIETDDLPSVTAFDTSSSAENTSLAETALDQAVFGEYVLQHFGNCTSVKEGSALNYETEYIIAGKDSDKDNLAAVVSDIVLLRTGCNMISLLKSSTKKAETSLLATSLVGFTGMPVLVKVFQILIMAAWSLAESIADVKALIGGHKVQTIKDDSDWYISLSGIKNFGSESISPEGTEKGLSYEAYLRILLLMQNKKVQYFRTMDLIQANMCLNENPAFRIADCITAISLEADYSAPSLFVSFPFVKSALSVSGGSYSYSIIQDYSY